MKDLGPCDAWFEPSFLYEEEVDEEDLEVQAANEKDYEEHIYEMMRC
jgi:hypothetical protein